MNTRTQTYVAALLSNPEFFNYLDVKGSFYKNGSMESKIVEAVHDLEMAFENPIHNEKGSKPGFEPFFPGKNEDESVNLGP